MCSVTRLDRIRNEVIISKKLQERRKIAVVWNCGHVEKRAENYGGK